MPARPEDRRPARAGGIFFACTNPGVVERGHLCTPAALRFFGEAFWDSFPKIFWGFVRYGVAAGALR